MQMTKAIIKAYQEMIQWNTGRKYDQNGQVMVAAIVEVSGTDPVLVFGDLTRGIWGQFNYDPEYKMYYDDLEDYVMTMYDKGYHGFGPVEYEFKQYFELSAIERTFPNFDNLDLYSDVQLLDPRFEDDSSKNEEQPSLALYGDNFNTMLKVFVGTKKDPFALCVLQVDSGSCGASIETNYPNSLEGMTKGLSHIANIVGGIN
jgi:hypothetical protein